MKQTKSLLQKSTTLTLNSIIMKTIKNYVVATIAILFSLLMISCGEDDSSSSNVNTVSSVTNVVTLGTWKITLFNDSGTDKTSQFSGYNFTFGTGNSLLATNGTNSYTGNWSVTDDNSDDDSISTLHFNVAFSTPANFAELTEDWKIIERTDTVIKLTHVSGGNGGTDYLTFTKN